MGKENEHGEGPHRARSLARRVHQWAERRPCSTHGGRRLLAWYGGGDTQYRLPGTDMVFKVGAQTAEFLRQTRETTGALVFGRRTFDLTHGWGGNHPLEMPVLLSTARSHQRGSTKDHRSGSSPTDSKAPSPKPKRSPG